METLLRICALSSFFVDIMRTTDGHYLARERGDIGFNAFMGKPNPRPMESTLQRAWGIFCGLSLSERKGIVRLARAKNVNLRDFLKKGGARVSV